MYYYILDYIQHPKFANFQKNLRQILTNLNINGEMAVSSPARSAEEIAELALERGYNTIVAVGSDLLVNRLANILAGSEAALGMIPYGENHLGELFCGQDMKSVCQSLKQRKTTFIDLGMILPDKYFLSDIMIQTEKPVRLHLEVDDKYTLDSEIYRLVVTRELTTEFSTEPIQQASSWWSRPKRQDQAITKFQVEKKLDIFTPSPISVTLDDGFEVVKTPIKVTIAQKVLKIIVNRDTIN